MSNSKALNKVDYQHPDKEYYKVENLDRFL